MEIIEIPVDGALRADAQQVLAAEGMTVPQAVEMFLRTVVQDQSSYAAYRVPSEATLAAIREADSGTLQEANTIEELFRHLDEGD